MAELSRKEIHNRNAGLTRTRRGPQTIFRLPVHATQSMEGETNFARSTRAIQTHRTAGGLLENKAAKSAWRSGDSPEYLCANGKVNRPLPLSLLLPNEEGWLAGAAWSVPGCEKTFVSGAGEMIDTSANATEGRMG